MIKRWWLRLQCRWIERRASMWSPAEVQRVERAYDRMFAEARTEKITWSSV